MSDLLTLSTFGKTDTGLVRTENEDHYLVCDESHVYAVADGLGGLPKGALASELAIQKLHNILNENPQAPIAPLPMEAIFQEINSIMHQVGHTVDDTLGIGTTLTVAQYFKNKVFIGHVGDSEAIVYRGEEVFKLTHDHTMAQQILDDLPPGEATPNIPPYFYHTLTRCVGQRPDIAIDTATFEVQSGDRIILVSDGVSKVIEADELQKHVLKAPDPKTLCEDTVRLANELGGPDNITIVALFLS